MPELPEPILIWPAEHSGVVTSGFHLVHQSLSSIGTIGNDVLPQGPVDARFICEITLPPKENLAGRERSGLIARLRGIRHRVRLVDDHRRIPAYNLRVLAATAGFSEGSTWSDSVGWLEGFLPALVAVAENAPRASRSVLMQGFPASLSSVLSMGDLFEVRPGGVFVSHAHLYEVTHVANSDADGLSRVEFEPGLRAGVAIGDQIVLRDPMSVFRLASEGEGRSTRDVAGHWRMGMTLVEVPLPLPGFEFGQ